MRRLRAMRKELNLHPPAEQFIEWYFEQNFKYRPPADADAPPAVEEIPFAATLPEFED